MFCTCITIVDLIFVDFLFYLSCIEICKMYITSKCSFSSIICMFKIRQSWLLYTFEKATNNSSCAKIIQKKSHNPTTSVVQEASNCLFLDLGFDFHLEFC